MRLVIAGATGFVASELIRQAMSHRGITAVVALGRREAAVPSGLTAGADASKLSSVVCSDFEAYSESVKHALSAADACIWSQAVGPSQSCLVGPIHRMPWEQVCKVCRDFAISGLETMAQLPRPNPGKALRFIYISGSSAERDAAKKLWLLGGYSLMRGDVESRILSYAMSSKGAVEATVAKPGLIYAAERTNALVRAVQMVACAAMGLPQITVAEIAAALLSQAVDGIEKDTLSNNDLTRIGRQTLAAQRES